MPPRVLHFALLFSYAQSKRGYIDAYGGNRVEKGYHLDLEEDTQRASREQVQ
jgi:hypothetical protein